MLASALRSQPPPPSPPPHFTPHLHPWTSFSTAYKINVFFSLFKCLTLYRSILRNHLPLGCESQRRPLWQCHAQCAPDQHEHCNSEGTGYLIAKDALRCETTARSYQGMLPGDDRAKRPSWSETRPTSGQDVAAPVFVWQLENKQTYERRVVTHCRGLVYLCTLWFHHCKIPSSTKLFDKVRNPKKRWAKRNISFHSLPYHNQTPCKTRQTAHQTTPSASSRTCLDGKREKKRNNFW